MSLEWLLIRGSGLIAFALLGLSTIWGLLLSSKILGRAVKAKGVTWFHESLGIGALLATIVHMVALSTHDFIDFTAADLLIPGHATWRPLAVSFGVIGFYVLVLVSLTFYVKPWIGQKAWRAIHHTAFGLFVATLAHGVLAGTDSSHPAVIALYVAVASVVGLLLVIRMLPAPEASPRVVRRSATVPTRSARSESTNESKQKLSA